MKYASGTQFLEDTNKSLLLMGLSGVGKTTVCKLMPPEDWFHFSVDYRIFTYYLSKGLNDYLTQLARKQPVLRDLLDKDAITVTHNVAPDNLHATTVFMGMLGDTRAGGRTEYDFRTRMKRHAKGEIRATLDIPRFKQRAAEEAKQFLADATGSLCEVIELDDPEDPIMAMLKKECLVIYIQATTEHTKELIRRAEADPKPIYYRPDFLDEQLPQLLKKFDADSVEKLDPSDVSRFLYPRIIEHRIPRYQQIADQIGYTIPMDDVLKVQTHQEFLGLVASAVDSN